MKSNKILYPKVVAGGTAVPLGKNFYYMSGRKHKDGGIDVGKNPNTGIEVEDEEIMHLTGKEVKVFSSVPFLGGMSPADKVLQGDNPTKVFNAQQKYKKDNNINDDGSKKQNGGKVIMRPKYAAGGPKKPAVKKAVNVLPEINTDTQLGNYDPSGYINLVNNVESGMTTTTNDILPTKRPFLGSVGNIFQKGVESVTDYYNERPGALNDTIGIASNITGGIIANKANNKMLDKLQYSSQPVARQATKLKTNININPQLDKMRESVAAYERDIDANTASSRVALARKQKGRIADVLQTNELYGNKENVETQLINQDKMNQQQVSNANTTEYNRWQEGKANFNNIVAEKKAENSVGLVETLNAGVQDMLTRSDRRNANRENMLAMSAGNPNVNPRILKDLGVKSITDKMIADWEKANPKKAVKSNNKSK